MSNRVILLAPLLLAACTPAQSDPQVQDARIIASPNGGAAYFTVDNKGSADRLINVDAPELGGASLHSTTHQGGVMRMRSIDALDVPANGILALTPGGNHVMIVGDNITPGASTQLVLTFEKAGTRTIEAPIQSIGDLHGDHK